MAALADTGLKNPVYNSTITIGGRASQAQSFADMAIISPHTNFLGLMETIGSLDAVTNLGFLAGDVTYDAFKAAFDQPRNPLIKKAGRIQVDAVTNTVLPVGQITTGTIYTMKGQDLADTSETTVSYTSVDNTETANGGTTGIAGAADIQFAGVTGDELVLKAGYTFEYSGDTTTAADGTYTVLADATELAGTVTITIVEALPAATFDGTITIQDDNQEVAAGLVAAWGVTALTSTASDNADGTFDVTTGSAGAAFTCYSIDRGKVTVAVKTLGGTGGTDPAKIQSSLTAIEAAGNTFYAINTTYANKDNQEAIATWKTTAAQDHIFICRTSDTDVWDKNTTLDTDSIWARLNNDSDEETLIIGSRAATLASTDEYVDAARTSYNMSFNPDVSYKYWLYEPLVGITSESVVSSINATPITDTQIGYLNSKNVDYYGTVNSRRASKGGDTEAGKGGFTPGGVPLSVTVTKHVLKTRFNEAVTDYTLNEYATTGNMPYTQQTSNAILGVLTKVVRTYQNTGSLNEEPTDELPNGYSIEMPDYTQFTPTQRQNGLWPGVEIKVLSAGSVLHITANINLGL